MDLITAEELKVDEHFRLATKILKLNPKPLTEYEHYLVKHWLASFRIGLSAYFDVALYTVYGKLVQGEIKTENQMMYLIGLSTIIVNFMNLPVVWPKGYFNPRYK